MATISTLALAAALAIIFTPIPLTAITFLATVALGGLGGLLLISTIALAIISVYIKTESEQRRLRPNDYADQTRSNQVASPQSQVHGERERALPKYKPPTTDVSAQMRSKPATTGGMPTEPWAKYFKVADRVQSLPKIKPSKDTKDAFLLLTKISSKAHAEGSVLSTCSDEEFIQIQRDLEEIRRISSSFKDADLKTMTLSAPFRRLLTSDLKMELEGN